jgi:uncharacterized membrane protein YphA (DoxX/SURF4 family)
MKILTVIVRILLGLVFVVFGSNGFLQFLPMPPLPHDITGDFLHAFMPSSQVTTPSPLARSSVAFS